MQIGIWLRDHLVVSMTENNLQQAGKTWKQEHLSTVISKRNIVKGLDVPKYNLQGVKGNNSPIWDHCIKGYYKLEDTFKMFECSF